MTEPESRAAAKRYIDRIIEVQRRHGIDPSISKKQYDTAVDETSRAFAKLTSAASDSKTKRR